MGEAKRRKKLDPNYGLIKNQKNDFKLEFLSSEESRVLVGDELRKVAKQAEAKGKYYFIRLITKEITIIGIAIPFLVGTEINVKCVWQKLENKNPELQNKIINKHLQQVVRKVALELNRQIEQSSF